LSNNIPDSAPVELSSVTPWRDVFLLSACWSLGIAALFIQVSVTTSVILEFRDNSSVATLALGLFCLTASCSVFPSIALIHRVGPRASFVVGLLAGLVGGALNLVGVLLRNVVLLLVGSIPQGVPWALALRYRFIASSLSETRHRPVVISITVLGGVLSTLLGPELSRRARTWISDQDYAGSFVVLMLLYLVHVVLIMMIRFKLKESQDAGDLTLSPKGIPALFHRGESMADGRSFNWWLLVGITGVSSGYGIMVGLMLAVPLALRSGGLSFDVSTTAIEAHMLGMFLPSLISGRMVKWLGAEMMVTVGFAVCVISEIIILAHSSNVPILFVSIVLVGIGWNFTFVGGSDLVVSASSPEQLP